MKTSSEFSRNVQRQQQSAQHAAQQQEFARMYAEASAENQRRDREEYSTRVREYKNQLDDNLLGTDPTNVFGPESQRIIDDFVSHMNDAGWPDAQTLVRFNEKPTSSIFGQTPPTGNVRSQLRGYCIGLAQAFPMDNTDPYARKKIQARAEGFTLFNEQDMVYLCEDGTLRTSPSHFESLPFDNEGRWYDRVSGQRRDSILKPVTPGIFARAQAPRVNPAAPQATKLKTAEVSAFNPRPDQLERVLFKIAVDPASGAPEPGFIPELHSVPPRSVPGAPRQGFLSRLDVQINRALDRVLPGNHHGDHGPAGHH